MVDVNMRMRGRDQTPNDVPQNPKGERRARRMQILKEARAGHEGIRVVPVEKYRHVLKHPSNGVGFRAKGGATWPNDKFTQRRLRDGSVTLEPKKEEKTEPAATTTSKPSAPAPSA